MQKSVTTLIGALALVWAAPSMADITIGVTVSASGPAAVLGGPQKNTTALFPSSVAGEKINWVVLDDATDPTNSARNAGKLISENKADVIIGSSTTATTAAMLDAIVEAKTPLMALAPIDLTGDKDKWTFRMPQHNKLMAGALLDHMKANNVKTLGFIGFSDPYGESWLKVIQPMAEAQGIKFGPVEKFNRTDTSVTGQAVKLAAANPDAILIVGSGAPAALPHTTLVDRGYKGKLYQTHGAPSPAFLKIGGKAAEGGIFVAGPLLEWDQLPDGSPTKANAAEYTKKYEEKYGAGSLSSFGGHMWDAWAIISRAVPAALKKGKPGTEAFRAGLRDAMEGEKDVVGVHGVFNMSPTDHFGHDKRARVLLQVQNGAFKMISQ